MSIDIDTARRVAKLARIRVEEDALPALAEEFNAVLGFIEQLQEVDVEGVEPMTSVTPQRLKRRVDGVTDGDQQEKILANAPDAREGFFLPYPKWWSEPMTDLNKLTLSAARDGLRAKEFTSVELTEACLSVIEGSGALNAFVHNTPDVARAQAAAADARLAAGDAPAMCGLPIGIKDLFCTKGVATQAASRILDGFKPEYESTITTKLFDAGAVMLGKLNMDEFAMGSSNETSVYGDA